MKTPGRFQNCAVFAIAMLVALSGCSSEPSTDRLLTLRVSMTPHLTSAPLFIAEEEGFFRDAGLRIKFIRLESALEGMTALDRGDLDVNSGILSVGFLNAIGRGARVRIVADKGYLSAGGCTFSGLIARRDLVDAGRLKTVANLRGRRIGLRRANLAGYYVETMLAGAGLSLDDVELVSLPEDVEVEALEKGTVDLLHASEPWITRITQTGRGRIWMPSRDVIPDSQYSVVLYGRNLLDRNRRAGVQFMRAYLKGVRRYNQGKTERNVQILTKYLGMEPALIRQMCWITFREDGRINIPSITRFETWALGKKFLDTLVAPEQFWDPAFVDEAGQADNEKAR